MLAEETVLWGPTVSLQSLRGVWWGIELTFLQLAWRHGMPHPVYP